MRLFTEIMPNILGAAVFQQDNHDQQANSHTSASPVMGILYFLVEMHVACVRREEEALRSAILLSVRDICAKTGQKEASCLDIWRGLVGFVWGNEAGLQVQNPLVSRTSMSHLAFLFRSLTQRVFGSRPSLEVEDAESQGHPGTTAGALEVTGGSKRCRR